MENIINEMIVVAIYYKEELNLMGECYDLLRFVKLLVDKMAITINCPSNWRDIGTELAKRYKDNDFIFDELELWNYED